jgi:hypothetical protein
LRVGGDTVSKVVSPVFTFWRICFIRSDANQGLNRQIWVERLERAIRFFRDTIQCPLIARADRDFTLPLIRVSDGSVELSTETLGLKCDNLI